LHHVETGLSFKNATQYLAIRREQDKVSTTSQGTKIRPPAVAGLFYPANPERLQTEISWLISDAAAPTNPPKALIAPHAGYAYSGRVAAAAFATLRDNARTIKRVVVIGPAHYVQVRGIAFPTVDAFETPLGRVPVERESLTALASLPFVMCADAPHAPEHALEVELPFLQTLLPSFELVPLVIGDALPQDAADVLGRLWGGPETLIVASSDLSHYHDYAVAQRLDAATAAAIERAEWSALGPRQACGFLAVAGLLMETSRRGLKARRLLLCNSGDTAGPRARVVGYGAWSFEAAA
jgi:hypothetical protein